MFARSPFEPLKELLAKIDGCVAFIEPMVLAWLARDWEAVKQHFKAITVAEHEADEIKNSIRDHLPRWVFMPIDRWHFLEIISGADKIADRAEDLGYMLTIRHTVLPEILAPDILALTAKSLECYRQLTDTVAHFDDLIEAGFAGPTAETVLEGIHRVGHLEWETDKLKYKLAQRLFEHEAELSPVDLIMIHDIALVLGQFADSAETLAKHIRRTLAR